jgi:hypothetical protein
MQLKQYGVHSIVEQKTRDLLVALTAYRDQQREVEDFAQFLEESRSLDELILFMRTRGEAVSSSTGVYWPGWVGERVSALQQKSTVEYASLDRALALLTTIFSQSPKTQTILSTKFDALAVLWEHVTDPPAPNQLLALTRGKSYDPRALDVPTLLELVMSEFRSLELEMRHSEWAGVLFQSVDKNTTGRIGFEGFRTIFATVQPRYTDREIAQMFTNLVRAAGSTTIVLSVFKKLVHQLMSLGVIFPVLQQAEGKDVEVINEVVGHWVKFRKFFDKLHYYLQHSPEAQDVEVSLTLQKLRFLFEKEITRGAQSRRIVSLYRGMLSIVMAHQGAWLLAATAPASTQVTPLEHHWNTMGTPLQHHLNTV